MSVGLVLVADAKGFFRDQGLRVELLSLATGPAALDAVFQGRAQFAEAGETPILSRVLGGQRLAVVTSVFRSITFLSIVARRDHGIASLRDLRGKRLSVAVGTALQYFVHVALTAAGVPERDVTFVNQDVLSGAAALRSGRVDAVATLPPTSQQLKAILGARSIVLSAPGLYTTTINLLTTPSYAAAHQDIVRRLVRGLAEAQAFIEQHPQTAQDLIARLLHSDPGQLQGVWPGLQFRIGLDQTLLIDLEQETAWMIRTGQVTRQRGI